MGEAAKMTMKTRGYKLVLLAIALSLTLEMSRGLEMYTDADEYRTGEDFWIYLGGAAYPVTVTVEKEGVAYDEFMISEDSYLYENMLQEGRYTFTAIDNSGYTRMMGVDIYGYPYMIFVLVIIPAILLGTFAISWMLGVRI
jgi:hypothetical protein